MSSLITTAASSRYPTPISHPEDKPAEDTDRTSKMLGQQDPHPPPRDMTESQSYARNFTPINQSYLPPSHALSSSSHYGHQSQDRYARPAAPESYSARYYDYREDDRRRYDERYDERRYEDRRYDDRYGGEGRDRYYAYSSSHGGYYNNHGQAWARQEDFDERHGQSYRPQYDDRDRYQYPTHSQVQPSQQEQAWGYGQGGYYDSYGRWQYPYVPAQQEAYAHSFQRYASSQFAPPAHVQWNSWSGQGTYHAHQQLLTPTQDEDLPRDNGVPLPPPSFGSNSESVVTKMLLKRLNVNGKSRSVTANPTIAKADKKQGPGKRHKQQQVLDNVASLMSDAGAPINGLVRKSLSRSPGPRLNLLKRPTPSRAYINQANQQPQPLELPQRLLVILDLNGTLLFRKKRGTTFTPRPHLKEFLDYLFAEHMVMVWSSARLENVSVMCNKLFTQQQRNQLVAVWAREHLRLSKAQYNEKVQVYKQLSWVWKDASIRAKTIAWSQADTVLIDDTIEKAASEPFNLIQIDEFEAKPEQMQTDVLGSVIEYLRQLQMQADVSAFMRTQPFKYGSEESPIVVA